MLVEELAWKEASWKWESNIKIHFEEIICLYLFLLVKHL
jgi:hypothetical protein